MVTLLKKLVISFSLVLIFAGISFAQLEPKNITVDPNTVRPATVPRFVTSVPTISFNIPNPEKIGLIGPEIPEEVFQEFEAVFGKDAVAPFRRQADPNHPDFDPSGRHPTIMLVYQPWIGFAYIDANGSEQLKQFIADNGITPATTLADPNPTGLLRAGVIPTGDRETPTEEWRYIIQKKVDAGVHRATQRVSLAQILQAMRGLNPQATIDDVVALVGEDTDLITLDGLPLLYAPVRGLDFDPEPDSTNGDYPNFLTINREKERITVKRWLAQTGLYLERCIEPAQFTGERDEFGNPVIANNPRLDTEDVVRAETLHILHNMIPNSLYTNWSDVFIETERIPVRNRTRGSNRNQGGFPNVIITDHQGLGAVRRSLRFCSLDCFLEADTRDGQQGRETSPTGSRIYRSIMVYKTAREAFAFYSNLLGPARDAQGGVVTTGPWLRQRGLCPAEGQSDQFNPPQ